MIRLFTVVKAHLIGYSDPGLYHHSVAVKNGKEVRRWVKSSRNMYCFGKCLSGGFRKESYIWTENQRIGIAQTFLPRYYGESTNASKRPLQVMRCTIDNCDKLIHSDMVDFYDIEMEKLIPLYSKYYNSSSS